MLRAILFDLDRTLLDRDKSFQNFLISQYERFSTALAAITCDAYVSKVTCLDDRGRIWKDNVYREIVDDLAITELSWIDLFHDFENRFPDYYVPFPNLHETLKRIRRGGYLLGLITNGREGFQRRTLRKLKIEHQFETILISESEGVRKPDKEIFLRAAHRLGCEAGECVYIGDHPEVDIRGAHDAGMRTIWKINDDFSKPKLADAICTDIKELPDLIQKLRAF